MKARSILLVLVLTACSSRNARVMNVNGRVVEYEKRAGNSSPTVVFEAGLGASLDAWDPIINRVGAPVFAYSRAGYGASSAAETKRTGAQIVEELREDLTAAGVRPPYILVGHSIGGTYMQLFAQRYPNEVAGLILVDSRPAEMTDRCLRELRMAPCRIPRPLQYLMPAAGRAEFAVVDETYAQIRAGGSLRNTPLVVISATKHSGGAGFNAMWADLQNDLARQSSNSRHIIATGSGHDVQIDRPEVIIAAIRDLRAVAAR